MANYKGGGLNIQRKSQAGSDNRTIIPKTEKKVRFHLISSSVNIFPIDLLSRRGTYLDLMETKTECKNIDFRVCAVGSKTTRKLEVWVFIRIS